MKAKASKSKAAVKKSAPKKTKSVEHKPQSKKTKKMKNEKEKSTEKPKVATPKAPQENDPNNPPPLNVEGTPYPLPQVKPDQQAERNQQLRSLYPSLTDIDFQGESADAIATHIAAKVHAEYAVILKALNGQ